MFTLICDYCGFEQTMKKKRVLGEWDCLLTEEDAAYVQPHQNYGI